MSDVPTGEAEVYEWVGHNRGRANQARDYEIVQADGVRPVLYTWLTNVLEGRHAGPPPSS